ncbi:iron complex transport system substrate-binding protein [Klenkia marina]|uniref:Iron complex transport system substrate-binding protein n=1 Tax=Klenkia marina TaxID=1960309 RepID=A0A1G4Y7D3_9ACTN|nr:ABC transporter substrate-binding protein [Klenkia marina]SCX49335.1 iron complex transport system substrate-binding protein [Klenkia marina]
MISSLRRSAAVPLGLAAVLALTSCGSDATADSAGGSAEAWTFTDDVGETITLDQAPERVASYADYALGLHSLDVDPVAVFGRVPVAEDERFADYDLSDVAVVGNGYGEIDIEAMAAAQPDVIVVGIYPEDREGTLDLEGPRYGLQDTAQQQQLEAIAPLITIEVGGEGQDVIDSLNRLALALGAEQSEVDAAQAEFDAAAADLQEAAETSGVEVTQMYADASSGIYVAKPDDEPEMELYREYGVDFTDLNPDDGNFYWDIYSWENASQMSTGDVLLLNVEGYQAEDLAAQPTFAAHPALVAGQAYEWNGAAMDYRSQAAHMAQLAEVLRGAQDVNPA